MTIKLTDIACFYGDKQALFDINLTIKKGETAVLLGPSGAGKSSLLRVFNLLEHPKHGEMQIADHHINFDSFSLKENEVNQLRQHVGMIFQQYNLWPHLTVLENLLEAPKYRLKMNKNALKEKAHTILSRLQLAEMSERYPLSLSGGQQQRVAIARALMMEPQILLFDEPTAALDPEITAQVANIINELAETDMTQIVVTHEVDFAKKIATQIVYMEQGKIIEQGDASRFESPQTDAFKTYLSY